MLAEASKRAFEQALRDSGRIGSDTKVVTEIVEAPEFYFAELYHQQYDAKPGNREYCGLRPLGVPCPPANLWGSHVEPTAATRTDASSQIDTPLRATAAESKPSSPVSCSDTPVLSATESDVDAPELPVPRQADGARPPPAPPAEQVEVSDPAADGAEQCGANRSSTAA